MVVASPMKLARANVTAAMRAGEALLLAIEPGQTSEEEQNDGGRQTTWLTFPNKMAGILWIPIYSEFFYPSQRRFDANAGKRTRMANKTGKRLGTPLSSPHPEPKSSMHFGEDGCWMGDMV